MDYLDIQLVRPPVAVRRPVAAGERALARALVVGFRVHVTLPCYSPERVPPCSRPLYRDHSTLESDPASWLGQDSRGTRRYRKARHFGDDFCSVVADRPGVICGKLRADCNCIRATAGIAWQMP